MPEAPGESDLRALARAFADAEVRVRRLVARAPNGDRRRLLAEALGPLIALRQLDPDLAVTRAYLHAFAAATSARARSDRADPERVGALAGALALKLDEAAQMAQTGVREAFSRVTIDNLEEMIAVASTGYIDAAGRRWPLGHYASVVTGDLGRQATSYGTVDGVGDGLVVVEGNSDDEVCGPVIGETFPASSAPMPPLHNGCVCLLTPAS